MDLARVNYIIVLDREFVREDFAFPFSVRLIMDRRPSDRYFLIPHLIGDASSPVLAARDEKGALCAVTELSELLPKYGRFWYWGFFCTPELEASTDKIISTHGRTLLPRKLSLN